MDEDSLHEIEQRCARAVDLYDPSALGEEVRALIAEVRRLRRALSSAEKTMGDWLKANSPGGWIDDLRVSFQSHGEQKSVVNQ
jgi:hypothetical protein